MSGIPFKRLERSADDVAADIHQIQMPDGRVFRLNTRQVEIMQLSRDEFLHLPTEEQVAFGKALMESTRDQVDEVLRNIDQNMPPSPEVSEELYEYTPLSNANCIRLIRMLPESEDGMLHLSLDEYDLTEHIPTYTCLSYCWNNPHATSNRFDYYGKYADDYNEQNFYPIACNGKLMYVRANLYDALQQLPEAPSIEVKFPFAGDYRTELQINAYEGDVTMVKTSAFRGARLDTKDTSGRTALSLAAMQGHADVVEALLKLGADPEIRDHNGKSCLDHALDKDRIEITELLLTFDRSRVERYERRNKHVGNGRLWIDALCINQNDVEEKNVQVGLMNRIYANASCTALWLGKDDGHAAQAAQTIDKLFPVCKTSQLGQAEIVPYRHQHPAVYAQAGIPYVSIQEWTSLAALYLRQNFIRLWCLQETVLQRNVVMFAGQQVIPWMEFMTVTDQLHRLQERFAVPPSTSFRPVYNAPVEMEAQLIYRLRRQHYIRNNEKGAAGKVDGLTVQEPLLPMIMSAIQFKCYDPRDHVYALLGMCQGHTLSPHIEIDYAKPFEEVYTEVMRLMLFQNRQNEVPCLELVACIKDSSLKQNEILPSWCLHYAQPGIAPFWLPKWEAAGPWSDTYDAKLAQSGRDNELILEGQRIDSIKATAQRRAHGGQRVTMFDFDPTWSALLLSLPQLYNGTTVTRTEALWRTLCADTPSTEDIIRLQRSANESGTETVSSVHNWTDFSAPDSYREQFKDQLCAMILSHADRAAYYHGKLRTTPGGVLLQALMQLQMEEPSDQPRAIYAPTQSEVDEYKDTSITGPYFADEAMQQTLAEWEALHQQDAADYEGPGCYTPSIAEIAAYLEEPKWRIWRPSTMPDDPNVAAAFATNADLQETPADAQAMDDLPLGEDGFRFAFARHNGGRRLFTTEGQYLGLGPMSMEIGDEVWILKGSRVPFLLRKVTDGVDDDIAEVTKDGSNEVLSASSSATNTKRRTRYKYIGDLYVHGIMKGEPIDPSIEWDEVVLV